MVNHSSLYIGIDFDQSKMQISYYNPHTKEIEPYKEQKDSESTILSIERYFTPKNTKWYHNLQFVKWLKGKITLIKEQLGCETIGCLCLTQKYIDTDFYEWLDTFAQESEIPRERIICMNHCNAFLHYILGEGKDVYSRKIGIFDFNYEGMEYYQYEMANISKKQLFALQKESYQDKLSIEDYRTNQDKTMDQAFTSIIKETVMKEGAQLAFLVGEGFERDWEVESIKLLCQNKRVFKGQNLYVKGAVRAARKEKESLLDEDTFVFAPGLLPYHIGLHLSDEENQIKWLIQAGTPWYQRFGQIEVILNHTNTLRFVQKHVVTKEEKEFQIELLGLPKRPNKTTRLEIDFSFQSEEAGQVLVKDLGFGQMYPTTNRIFRKEISLL